MCRCEAMARRRFNVFGDSVVEPKVIRVASQGPLPLYQRHKAAEEEEEEVQTANQANSAVTWNS
jgi:hypothetical protein